MKKTYFKPTMIKVDLSCQHLMIASGDDVTGNIETPEPGTSIPAGAKGMSIFDFNEEDE